MGFKTDFVTVTGTTDRTSLLTDDDTAAFFLFDFVLDSDLLEMDPNVNPEKRLLSQRQLFLEQYFQDMKERTIYTISAKGKKIRRTSVDLIEDYIPGASVLILGKRGKFKTSTEWVLGHIFLADGRIVTSPQVAKNEGF